MHLHSENMQISTIKHLTNIEKHEKIHASRIEKHENIHVSRIEKHYSTGNIRGSKIERKTQKHRKRKHHRNIFKLINNRIKNILMLIKNIFTIRHHHEIELRTNDWVPDADDTYNSYFSSDGGGGRMSDGYDCTQYSLVKPDVKTFESYFSEDCRRRARLVVLLGLACLVLSTNRGFTMTHVLVYSPFRLVFGTLYPAYASYKAVRTKSVKEYVSTFVYFLFCVLCLVGNERNIYH